MAGLGHNARSAAVRGIPRTVMIIPISAGCIRLE